jgi:hypothetical protein
MILGEISMVITEAMKHSYIDDVYAEMRVRGFTHEEIPRVIAKTGFMTALEEYPDTLLHFDIIDVVDDIVVTAARQ